MSMSLSRKVFLRFHCPCGGRVFRTLYAGRMNAGDDGHEIICSQIDDCCGDQGACGAIIASSGLIPWPLDVEYLFDAFASDGLTRADFDEQMHTLLKKVGANLKKIG